MGRRDTAVADHLPAIVRKKNKVNEQKTQQAMAENIWSELESGRDRRRRLAFERACSDQQHTEKPSSSDCQTDGAPSSSGKRQKQPKDQTNAEKRTDVKPVGDPQPSAGGPASTSKPTTSARGSASIKKPTTLASGSASIAKPTTSARGSASIAKPTTSASGSASIAKPTTSASGSASIAKPTTSASGPATSSTATAASSTISGESGIAGASPEPKSPSTNIPAHKTSKDEQKHGNTEDREISRTKADNEDDQGGKKGKRRKRKSGKRGENEDRVVLEPVQALPTDGSEYFRQQPASTDGGLTVKVNDTHKTSEHNEITAVAKFEDQNTATAEQRVATDEIKLKSYAAMAKITPKEPAETEIINRLPKEDSPDLSQEYSKFTDKLEGMVPEIGTPKAMASKAPQSEWTQAESKASRRRKRSGRNSSSQEPSTSSGEKPATSFKNETDIFDLISSADDANLEQGFKESFLKETSPPKESLRCDTNPVKTTDKTSRTTDAFDLLMSTSDGLNVGFTEAFGGDDNTDCDLVHQNTSHKRSVLAGDKVKKGVWFEKALYDEAERDFYENKFGRKVEQPTCCNAVTSAEREAGKEHEAILKGLASSVWLEKDCYSKAEKQHQEHLFALKKHEQQKKTPMGQKFRALSATSERKSPISLQSGSDWDDDTTQGISTWDEKRSHPPSFTSPASLQMELEDMYYEDMILPGRQSDVTMTSMPGFTASALSEILSPEEQLESLRTEPDLDMSELNPDSIIHIPMSYAAMAAKSPTDESERRLDDTLCVRGQDGPMTRTDEDGVDDQLIPVVSDQEKYLRKLETAETCRVIANSTPEDSSAHWVPVETKKDKRRRHKSERLSGSDVVTEPDVEVKDQQPANSSLEPDIADDIISWGNLKSPEVTKKRNQRKKKNKNRPSSINSTDEETQEKYDFRRGKHAVHGHQIQQHDVNGAVPILLKSTSLDEEHINDAEAPVVIPKPGLSTEITIKSKPGATSEPSTSKPILEDRNMYLPDDDGKTYASLLQQGRDMLPARPVFQAHACHVCKRIHSKQTRLKSCGNCRLVAYCSPQHQRAHWPLHRGLCKVIVKRMQQLGVSHLYSEALNVGSDEKWKQIRFQHMSDCEDALGKPMEAYEKEMFLYPRACDTCHETTPEKLHTCSKCHSVSFCHEKHLRPTHAKYCKDLRLLVDIHTYQNERGVCDPMLPDVILDTYEPLPLNIREFLVVKMLGPVQAYRMGGVELAVLSDYASYPLSMLYALENIPTSEKGHISRLTSLTVHVVGAEFNAECDSITKWDSFLLHLLPALRHLHVVFIGAELQIAGPGPSEEDLTTPSSRAANKRFTVEFRPNTLYHTYCSNPQFRRPDVVCAFNARLHRFAGHETRDKWQQSLPCLVRDGVPLIITGYSMLEVPQDVARVQQEQRVDVLLPPMKNPYRSTRPQQNFLDEHVAPLIYKNQYISCLSARGRK